MAEDDWDLYAVVRGCKSATSTATGLSFNTSSTTTQNYLSCLSKLTFDEDDAAPFTFPSVVQSFTTDFHELQQACIPFMGCGTTTTTKTNAKCGVDISISASSVSDLGESIGRQQQQRFQFGGPNLKPRIFHGQHHQQQQQQQPHQIQIAQNNIGSCAVTLSNTSSQPTKSRKRKSQQKRLVCHVPHDKLSSDLWAWRKYGQKPIKGSPYPRNYYRCSSSKGCAARKQVERSTKDPELFIVTYTGEHTHPRPTHRNSLAGSTRPRLSSAPQKLDSQSAQLPGSKTAMNNNTNQSSSSPMSASPTTPATSSPPEDETQSRDMEIEDAAAENHVLDDVDGFTDVDVDDDL